MDDTEEALEGLKYCSILMQCITYPIVGAIFIIGLVKHSSDKCEHILELPIFWVSFSLGMILLVFSCCTCFSGSDDADTVLALRSCELLASFIIFVCFLCTCVFLLSVTHKGGGEVLPGKAYKEYRLNDYSKWLQHRVNSTKKWSKIKKCLSEHHVCKRMITGDWANSTLEQFYTKRLSSVESGCCKPSNNCNFSYVSPTNWTQAINSTFTNPVCHSWKNDPNVLCFDCQSCKAGVVDKYKHNWIIGMEVR